MTVLAGTVAQYLEADLGFPIESLPAQGVSLRESSARADRENARLLAVRLGGAALATGTPSVARVTESFFSKLDIWEVFSPFGVAELTRALATLDAEAKGGGFHYTLGQSDFVCPRLSVEPDQLIDMPKSEAAFGGDWLDAFCVYQDGQQVALSRVRWNAADFIEIDVETSQEHRSRGYGTAVVAKAAQWILKRQAIAHYAVLPSNIQSVRIPNRLGFSLTWQEIYA